MFPLEEGVECPSSLELAGPVDLDGEALVDEGEVRLGQEAPAVADPVGHIGRRRPAARRRPKRRTKALGLGTLKDGW